MDIQAKRLGGAIVASLLVNGILWWAFGSVVLGPKAAPPQIIEISRVVLSKSGPPKPKVVTRRQIVQRVEQIRKLNPPKRLVRPLHSIDRPHRIVPPQPKFKGPSPKPRFETPQSMKLTKPAPKTPEGAHNKTLASLQKPDPNAGVVKSGGKMNMGKPPDAQNDGNKNTNPANSKAPAAQAQPTDIPSGPGTPSPGATSDPPPPAPVPEPTVAPTNTPTPRPTEIPTPKPQPTPTNTPKPPPTPTPRPEPTDTPKPPPTPRPEPTNTPRPKGPNRPASYKPPRFVIPSEMADIKDSVRTRITINTDGSVSATLLSSSGNSQVDSIILRALEGKRGKPKLRDGEAFTSTIVVVVEIPR